MNIDDDQPPELVDDGPPALVEAGTIPDDDEPQVKVPITIVTGGLALNYGLQMSAPTY